METVNGIFAIVGLLVGWFVTYTKFKIERKDKFRMAAIDKRLEAHQRAYAVCLHFWEVVDSDNIEEIKSVTKEAKELMTNYSLYLESDTRKLMVRTIGFFNAYCPREKFINKFEGEEERKKALEIYLKEEKCLDDLSIAIQSEVALEPVSLISKKI